MKSISFAVVQHGQMAQAVVAHDLHALLAGLVWLHKHHGRGHHVLDLCDRRGSPHQRDLAGVVALGKDADDGLALGDDERTNALVVAGRRASGTEAAGVMVWTVASGLDCRILATMVMELSLMRPGTGTE